MKYDVLVRVTNVVFMVVIPLRLTLFLCNILWEFLESHRISNHLQTFFTKPRRYILVLKLPHLLVGVEEC